MSWTTAVLVAIISAQFFYHNTYTADPRRVAMLEKRIKAQDRKIETMQLVLKKLSPARRTDILDLVLDQCKSGIAFIFRWLVIGICTVVALWMGAVVFAACTEGPALGKYQYRHTGY